LDQKGEELEQEREDQVKDRWGSLSRSLGRVSLPGMNPHKSRSLRDPHDPPGGDGLGRAELPALETGHTQMGAKRFCLMVYHLEDSHGTEIDAGTASVAEDAIDIYLHQNGRRGAYFQNEPPFSGVICW